MWGGESVLQCGPPALWGDVEDQHLWESHYLNVILQLGALKGRWVQRGPVPRRPTLIWVGPTMFYPTDFPIQNGHINTRRMWKSMRVSQSNYKWQV